MHTQSNTETLLACSITSASLLYDVREPNLYLVVTINEAQHLVSYITFPPCKDMLSINTKDIFFNTTEKITAQIIMMGMSYYTGNNMSQNSHSLTALY